MRTFDIWAIPQKMLPQGGKMKLNIKCFLFMKLKEEGLYFDNQVKKLRYCIILIFFQQWKEQALFTCIAAKNCTKCIDFSLN